jgi:hypothetical protein
VWVVGFFFFLYNQLSVSVDLFGLFRLGKATGGVWEEKKKDFQTQTA